MFVPGAVGNMDGLVLCLSFPLWRVDSPSALSPWKMAVVGEVLWLMADIPAAQFRAEKIQGEDRTRGRNMQDHEDP